MNAATVTGCGAGTVTSHGRKNQTGRSGTGTIFYCATSTAGCITHECTAGDGETTGGVKNCTTATGSTRSGVVDKARTVNQKVSGIKYGTTSRVGTSAVGGGLGDFHTVQGQNTSIRYCTTANIYGTIGDGKNTNIYGSSASDAESAGCSSSVDDGIAHTVSSEAEVFIDDNFAP